MALVKAPLMLESTARRVVYAPTDARLVSSGAVGELAPRLASGGELAAPIDLDALREQQASALESAYRRGFDDGMEEGRIQAEDGGAMLAERLVASLGQAVEMMAKHLSDSAELTAQLLHLMLDKLAGSAAARAPLVSGLIGEQLRHIDPKQLLLLEVAAVDFPQPELLDEVLAGQGLSELKVRYEPLAASGSCRLHVRGEIIDASLACQITHAHETIDQLLRHAQ